MQIQDNGPCFSAFMTISLSIDYSIELLIMIGIDDWYQIIRHLKL